MERREAVGRPRNGKRRILRGKAENMENFEFVSPTRFVFGHGVETQVGERLASDGARRALIHYGGGSAVASGLVARVRASLEQAGVTVFELGGVRPNPEIALVREGVALCKRARRSTGSSPSEAAASSTPRRPSQTAHASRRTCGSCSRRSGPTP